VVGAKIEVDAARAGATPLEAVRVAAGSHTVAISADGYGSERREVLVASGVTVPVAIELTAIPVAVPTVAPIQPPLSVPRAAPAEKVPTSNGQTTWGWVSIVVGGMAATTGGVWLGMNANHRAQARAEYDSVAEQEADDTGLCDISGGVSKDDCNAEIARVTANLNRSDVPAYIDLGVGAAAIGVGIVLLLTADHPHQTSAARMRSPFVRPSGARGALLSLSF
jgi:hypothetical protein